MVGRGSSSRLLVESPHLEGVKDLSGALFVRHPTYMTSSPPNPAPLGVRISIPELWGNTDTQSIAPVHC